MPTYTHPTISIVAPTDRGPGRSDTATLKTLFPGAPGATDYVGTEGSATYKQTALNLLLSGEINDNLQTGAVDRDFGASASDEARKPPTYGAVETGGGGLPASAWVPNPTSPGAGSVDPNDQAEPTEGYGTSATNSIANIGASSDVTQPSRDPATSSQRMSQGREFASYSPGRSPATANAS